MQDIGNIEARLQAAASLPDLLAASFDVFEAIRRIARSCEDQVPEALMAAFMTTADGTVDGREADYPARLAKAFKAANTVIRPLLRSPRTASSAAA